MIFQRAISTGHYLDLDRWGGETSRSSNQAFQSHRYTSYERDANGGDEAMMRRYQSYWNRFSQPDPYDGSYDFTDPQSFNRYAYTHNDPVNFIDPSGLDQWDAIPGFIPAWMNGWNRTLNPTETFINYSQEITAAWHDFWGDMREYPWFFGGFSPFSFGPQKPPKDIEEPCIKRIGAVTNDLRAIARMVHGRITNYDFSSSRRHRFPGVEISPRGQTFGQAMSRLRSNSFVTASVLGIQSLDHPEGENFQKQFSDGLWYHVVVNFPTGTDSNSADPRRRTPLITAHCHATNPTGVSHILDSIP